MEQFRDRFEHHWIIEMSDEGINEARKYFKQFFNELMMVIFLNVVKKKVKKLHFIRFVSASAIGRYHSLEY